VTPRFLCIGSDAPPGFVERTPTKADLLGGPIAIWAASLSAIQPHIVPLLPRICGLVLTPATSFQKHELAPTLWHLELPPVMYDDAQPMASSFLDLLQRVAAHHNDNLCLRAEAKQSLHEQAQNLAHYHESALRIGRLFDALQANETKYRTLLENLSDAIVEITLDAKIIFCSPQLTEILGYPREAFWEAPAYDFVHPDDVGKLQDLVQQALQSRTVKGEVVRARRQDGIYKYLSLSGRVIEHPDGHLSIVGIVKDVDEKQRMADALQAAQERYDLALAAVNDGIWDWDLMTQELFFDAGCYRLTGYAPDAFPSTFAAWFEHLHPADRTAFEDAFSAHIEGDSRGLDVSFRIRHQEGHWIWLRARGRVVTRSDAGTPRRMMGTLTNITAWRAAEDALRESEEQLRITLDSIGDAVMAVDVAGRVVRMNPVAESLTGWSLPEAQGRPLEEVFHIVNAFSGVRAPNPAQLVLASGTVVGLANHTTLIARSGNEVQIADSAAPILDATGRTVGVVLVFRDVTEAYRVQEALRKSEETFRSLVESSPMGIYLYELSPDDQLVFQGANPAADHIIGIDHGDFVGSTLDEIFPPLLETEVPYHFRRAAVHGEVWRGQVPYQSGEIKGIFEVTAFRMAPRRIGVMFSDISTQIQTLAALQQSQKMEAIGMLAGGIAHDFNNMLGVILGNVSFALCQVEASSELREVLEDVQKGAQQAQTLTGQLLTFARGGEPIKKLLDLSQLVTDCAGFVTRGSTSRCHIDCQEGLWAAEVDPGQINQALSNILINAIQAVPHGGIIHIHCHNVAYTAPPPMGLPAGHYVQIDVTDQGPGIPEEQLPRVFDPFFSTKRHDLFHRSPPPRAHHRAFTPGSRLHFQPPPPSNPPGRRRRTRAHRAEPTPRTRQGPGHG